MKTPEEIAYDAGRQVLAVQESLVTEIRQLHGNAAEVLETRAPEADRSGRQGERLTARAIR
jgi:hypothetical protein